jgi:hypothetical protein
VAGTLEMDWKRYVYGNRNARNATKHIGAEVRQRYGGEAHRAPNVISLVVTMQCERSTLPLSKLLGPLRVPLLWLARLVA